MNRSPLALALVAVLGITLPSTPAFAQQANPSAAVPISTGTSSLGGAFPVSVAVYDAQSFELS